MNHAPSTAHLRPPWQAGESGNARGSNRGYRRVIAAARAASPEAMEKAIACMRDEAAPWPARLKAIELILDRAWGAPEQHHALEGDGITALRIEFVSPGEPQPLDQARIEAETFEITFPPLEGEAADANGAEQDEVAICRMRPEP